MFKKRKYIILSAILLLGIFFSVTYQWKKDDGTETFRKDLEHKLGGILKEFDEDYMEILLNNRPDTQVSFSTLDRDTKHPYYLFSNEGDLMFWSEISMIPSHGDFQLNRKFQLIENAKGVFFGKIRKLTRNQQEFWVLQIYPLSYKVALQNDYLPSGSNHYLFGNDRYSLSNQKEPGYADIHHNGDYLFSINYRVGYDLPGTTSNRTLLVFFFSLLSLVIILGVDFVQTIWRKGNRPLAISYAALILFSIRGLMLKFSFPQDFFETGLFNPGNYASSLVNPSLGDLLLNVICIVIVLGLILASIGSSRVLVQFNQHRRKIPSALLLVVVLILSTLLMVIFFELFLDIVKNSQWNLNIQSLPTFTYFHAISLIIVFLGGAAYVVFSIIGLNLVLSKNSLTKKRALNILLYLSFPIAIGLFYMDRVIMVAYLSHFVFIGAIITFDLYDNIFKLDLSTFMILFFGCFVGATITGAAAYQHARLESVSEKQKFANQVMIEDDLMGDYMMGEVMDNIRGDNFIINRLYDPSISKEPIGQKIKKIYLTNYLDQFSSAVMVFNRSGESLTRREQDHTLDEYRNLYMKSDYATTVRNLYYVKGGLLGMPNKYVAFISIYKDSNFLGTIVIELTQQRILPSSVFPKLLFDKQYVPEINESNIDYAVFSGDYLQFSTGIFNYRNPDMESVLSDPVLLSRGVNFGGYHHYGVQSDEGTVLVSSPSYPMYFILADVALFFVAYLVLMLLSILAYMLSFGLKHLKFNYTTKLQLYLNFAFFFPMLVTSVVAVGFLSRSYTEDLHRQYMDKASIIRDNLANFLEVQQNGVIDENEIEELTNEIYGLAATTHADINIYLPNGKLIATNQPKIFEKKILTKYLNPKAYAAIIEAENNRILLEENVGELNYKSVYMILREGNRQQIQGIIAIPFFESEDELNDLIADVISNILIIFVVLFIIFLVISFVLSKSLTYPFRLLTQKLKVTNLESNEYMNWPSKDEIGLLVSEYNNMLAKLEASKKVLASNEKESAWREMAKQVAHEIKNPLTPMKLTLQHLLRLQSIGGLDDPKMLKKPIETLIHQVDTLSDIATSFSTFAKMPLPQNEEINFRVVLGEVLELYRNREDVVFTFKDEASESLEIFIMGDPKLFGRVISNLIINGIQAVDQFKVAEITVTLTTSNGSLILEIRDNGKGIPDDHKEKIFIPNFSTKSEGSGLGLAIAKRGVETAGGNIWFETQDGIGTSFFLSFPLLK
ncbi:MAG TPA: ATP-binding protein [Lunatimonas sp.]|nr:ATP-binding protein [Lunatimonas sp.]